MTGLNFVVMCNLISKYKHTPTGAETETRAVAEMETGTRMGTGKGTRTGSGRVEERQRSARNHTKNVDATRHFCSARVIISADRG